MGDVLSDIENEILELIYRKEFEIGFEIHIGDLPLTEKTTFKTNEAGYYLEKLKKSGYLEFTNKDVIYAGSRDSRYKNNIIMIYWENIDISHKGKNYIKQRRKSRKDKIFESIKNFITDVGKELRSKVISHLVGFIIGVMFSYIYYIFVIR